MLFTKITSLVMLVAGPLAAFATPVQRRDIAIEAAQGRDNSVKVYVSNSGSCW